jgi:hypothetical protein
MKLAGTNQFFRRQYLCPFAVLIFITACLSALNDPFPMGYSMGNFGTMMRPDGISGRQPWTPAAQLRGVEGFGLSAAGVDYYDDMDNFTNNNIRQASIGGWVAIRTITVKTAYTHFNALEIYREQQGFLSVGSSVIPFISTSAEISGYSAGLIRDRNERQTVALFGATVMAPWNFASASIGIANILMKDAHRPGFAPPAAISIGIHSAPHRFGAQGITITVEPEDQIRIRFRAGEEYWIGKTVGLGAAVSTNPLMIGFSVTAAVKHFAAFCSLVHHPILGWSKGIGTDYHFKSFE